MELGDQRQFLGWDQEDLGSGIIFLVLTAAGPVAEVVDDFD